VDNTEIKTFLPLISAFTIVIDDNIYATGAGDPETRIGCFGGANWGDGGGLNASIAYLLIFISFLLSFFPLSPCRPTSRGSLGRVVHLRGWIDVHRQI
jgi:hypothetical protein